MSTYPQIEARLERHLETVRRVREWIEEDPSVALLLLEVIAPTVRRAEARGGTASAPTHLDRVTDFFESRDNEWATAREIAAGSGVPRVSVGTVLYKRDAALFERRADPSHGKRMQFRLAIGASR